MKKGDKEIIKNNELIGKAFREISGHPLFEPFMYDVCSRSGPFSEIQAYVQVDTGGNIAADSHHKLKQDEWAFLIAGCMLHLGFGHWNKEIPEQKRRIWNMAAVIFNFRFIREMKIGKMPGFCLVLQGEFPESVEGIYRDLLDGGLTGEIESCFAQLGYDMNWKKPDPRWTLRNRKADYGAFMAEGIRRYAYKSLRPDFREPGEGALSRETREALDWFVSSFPLLGALASGFTVIEDAELCSRMEVSVAAVNSSLKEIYLRPVQWPDIQEVRFILAHELLHVGLRHEIRRQGRDAYLWNVACDYVINHWLQEMNVGTMPAGVLYDEELKGKSAEEIYDIILENIKKYKKLATLAGIGRRDIIDSEDPVWWERSEGVSLDEFFRSCMMQGLEYAEEGAGRGLLPAGLVEEIKALAQPPIPWDAELAKWFDRHFIPLERRRSYTRLSRRQFSTPEIPRPAYLRDAIDVKSRTFGVVIDTSGSMNRELLGKALGTVASFSIARDVPAVRVIFCDAHPYDQGFLTPESIAGKVKVTGRGGTVLQPGIRLLEEAKDFPEDAPILIITDGECDRLKVRREHAYVIPAGRRLPFPSSGEVFYVK